MKKDVKNKKVVKMPKRKQKRRVRKSFIAVVFIFMLCVLAILSTTVLFPINSVEVEKPTVHYSKEQILKSADVKKKSNLLVLSENDVSNKVESELPYVGNVKVTKVFPDKILLTATEYPAFYCISYKNSYYLLSKNQKVLEKIKKPSKNTVFLNETKCDKIKVGKKAVFNKKYNFKIADKIANKLIKKGYSINTINVSNFGDITAVINNKFYVKFGTETKLDEKLNFLNTMISKIDKKEPDSKGTVNLTYFPTKKEGYYSKGYIKDKIKYN